MEQDPIKDFLGKLGGEQFEESQTEPDVESSEEEEEFEERVEIDYSAVIEEEQEQQEEVAETQEVETETEAPTFEQMWQEKYGDKFGSLEDLEATISSLKEKAEQPRIEDDFSKESLELVKKIAASGFDMNKLKSIAEIQTLDVDSMSSLDAIKKQLKMEKGLSPEELKYELRKFERHLAKDIEDLDEEEKDEFYAVQAELNRMGRSAKEYIKSLKDSDDYKIPELNSSLNSKELEAQQEEARIKFQKEYEEAKSGYEALVNEFVGNKKQIEVSLGELGTIKYTPTAEEQQLIKDAMFGVNQHYKGYQDPEKGVDFEKMYNDYAAISLLPKILTSAIESKANRGTEKAIKEISNVTLGDKPTSGAPKANAMDAIIAGFRKANGL